MPSKLVKGLFLALLALLILIPAALLIGSRLSLDGDYSHTTATAALPLLDTQLDRRVGPELVRIAANGYEFRARVRGNSANAETVILLHGFPVTSAMWEDLMEPLADAGYRVVAFDQRGYSPGARPLERSAYAVNNLTSDVLAVADAVNAERFHLVGHDWGSAVGWATVLEHPQRILSWTGISIAHPAAFAEALAEDPDQQSRSGYFTLFVTPLLPEMLFTFNGLMALEQGVYGSMSPSKLEEYLAVFSEPGALTAALNWYRQMGESIDAATQTPQMVTTPSLFIWGENDPTAGRAAVDAQEKYMKGPYRRLDLAGDHWLLSSHPDEVAESLISHLRQHGG